jgi:hypothetical protein
MDKVQQVNYMINGIVYDAVSAGRRANEECTTSWYSLKELEKDLFFYQKEKSYEFL